MNKKIILSLLVLISFAFVSCERFPISQLNDLPAAIKGWPNPWYIYDDEINTKGSFVPEFFGKNDEPWRCWDKQPNCLNFKKQITFEWRPKTNPGGFMSTWCMFGLKTRQEDGGEVDMSTSGYNKLKFKVKKDSFFTSGCSCEISMPLGKSGKGTATTWSSLTAYPSLTTEWQEYEMDISGNKDSWNSQEYYIAICLKNGDGGRVYIDDIRFER